MTHLDTLPLWLAIPVAILVVIGSTLTLLGALGFVQLRNFYDRLHAPTLGTSWGAASLLLAGVAVNSWNAGELVLHEIVIGCFLIITMPITLMLLGRAALYRDRAEDSDLVPSFGSYHPSTEDDDEDDAEEEDPAADFVVEGGGEAVAPETPDAPEAPATR